MKLRCRPSLALSAALLLAGTACNVSAQLPSIGEGDWLGYFVGHKASRFLFGIDAQGTMLLNPNTDAQNAGAGKLFIKIQPLVLEQRPDGGVTTKQNLEDSTESDADATMKLEKVVYRGKVTGDAQYEVTVEQLRGVIMVGGRLLSPGSLKNPLRFALRVDVPDFYENLEIPEDLNARQAERHIEKIMGKDLLTLESPDKKRLKFKLMDKIDFKAAGLADGIFTHAEIESGAIKGRKYVLQASPNSQLRFGPTLPEPRELYKGWLMTWEADLAKDPEGKARLAISAK